MNKHDCPVCHIEMIPARQKENCIQEYKCPACGFSDLYDSLPLENWKEGIDNFLEVNKDILNISDSTKY